MKGSEPGGGYSAIYWITTAAQLPGPCTLYPKGDVTCVLHIKKHPLFHGFLCKKTPLFPSKQGYLGVQKYPLFLKSMGSFSNIPLSL